MKPTLQAKLAAIVVHADEMLGPDGHHFDTAALRALVVDPEVAAWVESLGPLAPVKRPVPPSALHPRGRP